MGESFFGSFRSLGSLATGITLIGFVRAGLGARGCVGDKDLVASQKVFVRFRRQKFGNYFGPEPALLGDSVPGLLAPQPR